MITDNRTLTSYAKPSLVMLFCLALLVATPLRDQRAQTTTQPSPEDRIALYQALLDLTNPWTVMCIAAHPDDEDGTSLIVMRRKYGAHTVSLFSTFGEGGQNAIGPELYEEMGAIRARETMAAAEIQGSEPHFLGLKDFGYSKSADEAFKFWGHDEALRRMVLEIRKLRPDVIITNHSATSNDHGHHQATARLELEAFDAAADPKRFPEQLTSGVTVWQVQRLFVRARGNAAQSDNAPVVTIDPNDRDPIRNTVFAEEALRALQKHATQGPWPKTFAEFAARFRSFTGQSAAPGQLPLTRYRLVREAKGAEPLPQDSHNFLDGLRLPEEVAKQLAPPMIDNRPLTASIDERQRILDALVGVRKSAQFRPAKVDDAPRFERMDQRLDDAFAAVTRITARTTPRDEVVSPGSKTTFTVTISNNGETPVTVYSYTFFAGKRNVKTLYTGSSPFPPNDSGSVTDDWTIPADTGPSLPHPQHLYDGRIFGDEFREVVVINLAGIQFAVSGATSVDVAPAVEVTTITPQAVVVSAQNPSPYFTLKITNHERREFRGRVIPKLVAPCESIACKEAAFEDSILLGLHRSTGETIRLAPTQSVNLKFPIPLIPVHRSGSGPAPRLNRPYQLAFRTERPSKNGSWETIGESMAVVVSYADARMIPNLRVGYIRGFDFSLPNALNALGVESKELSVDEVKTADLRKFTSIIVDNRVYESQPELIAANQKLLDYANAGGTLIVFYHKSNEWNPDPRRNRPQQLAPYKLILGDERITDETAPITFIEPEHPLLNSPNKMGQEDFANWIQERGLYYPKEWDANYHALLQSNDPGEAPLKGGLLVADYGRGHYIYTSMVWYRELRAGIPGAYRMLANMISYGQAEGKRKK
jgi:LmbE family N-acetylglucosaminyl deacetylase